MQVDDLYIPTQPLEQLLKDPRRRHKMIKILLQTLHNLGYRETIEQLQKQSGITYLTPGIVTIRNHLHVRNYASALAQIDLLHLEESFKCQLITTIMELQLRSLIQSRQGQGQGQGLKTMEQCLQLLQSDRIPQEKKEQWTQWVVFSIKPLSEEQREKIHQKIVDRCVDDGIQIDSMEKIILNYIKLQKQGIAYDSKFNLSELGSLYKDPPMKVISTLKVQHSISHLKYDRFGTKFVAIQQAGGDIIFIGLYKIQSDTFMQIKRQKFTIGGGRIQAVSWNYIRNGEQIAICSYESICIISIPDMGILANIASTVKVERNLSVDWHPISNLLYVCGLYTSLKVYTATGQLLTTVVPICKLRDIAFVSKGMLFGIAATQGKIIKYDVFQEKEKGELKEKLPFMSFAVNEKQAKIIVSNMDFILILDMNLKVLSRIPSPQNPQHSIILVKFFNPWAMLLGNHFIAYHQAQPLTKYQSWPGNGVFDVAGDRMISGKKELILWRSGPSYQQGVISMQEEQMDEDEDGDMSQDQSDQDMQDSSLQIDYFQSQNIQESEQ